ncbi:hypothetical protein BDN71DRAFT_1594253 [Pleurotus eryngii]|uniref:Uncharacterized protein n=1 Tax=Pleurotus eryngii TaxID=5323 RepID=A0A9P5ZI35_PLEER|nr:hypothetical protein BDN71DRAFT_1594253 [Pleurotus eryngii]
MSNNPGEIPIDPVLLLPQEVMPHQAGALVPKADYKRQLNVIKRKEPFHLACSHLSVRISKKATLERLRGALVGYWYPEDSPAGSQSGRGASLSSPTGLIPVAGIVPQHSPELILAASTPADGDSDDDDVPSDDAATRAAQQAINAARDAFLKAQGMPTMSDAPIDFVPIRFEDIDIEINDTGISTQLNKVLGEFDAGYDDEDEEFDLDNNESYKQFQTSIRIAAATRTEANRRAGGKKTSKANLKCRNMFVEWGIKQRLLRDGIVDEHSMLLYGFYTANRPQHNRRGEDIPNTCVGASQIKKEMFGAICLCKVQEAKDSTLKARRPSATVYVYDIFRMLMDEALRNKYEGLIEGEDAPDVVANTFLDHVTDETLVKIGKGFLSHREVKSAIMEHLVWILMNATGCCGDDIHALKLCELQPYELVHPTYHTPIFAILGVQSQHKAQQRKMSTTVNLVYTTFVAHCCYGRIQGAPTGMFTCILAMDLCRAYTQLTKLPVLRSSYIFELTVVITTGLLTVL